MPVNKNSDFEILLMFWNFDEILRIVGKTDLLVFEGILVFACHPRAIKLLIEAID